VAAVDHSRENWAINSVDVGIGGAPLMLNCRTAEWLREPIQNVRKKFGCAIVQMAVISFAAKLKHTPFSSMK
jgi:hypothetical protein